MQKQIDDLKKELHEKYATKEELKAVNDRVNEVDGTYNAIHTLFSEMKTILENFSKDQTSMKISINELKEEQKRANEEREKLIEKVKNPFIMWFFELPYIIKFAFMIASFFMIEAIATQFAPNQLNVFFKNYGIWIFSVNSIGSMLLIRYERNRKK